MSFCFVLFILWLVFVGVRGAGVGGYFRNMFWGRAFFYCVRGFFVEGYDRVYRCSFVFVGRIFEFALSSSCVTVVV